MSSGRPAEFGEFVASRADILLRCAFLLTGSKTDADDAVQATLVKVYVNWPRITRASDMDAYVHRMLINTVRRSARRQGREVPMADPSQASLAAVSEQETYSLHPDLAVALRKLPIKQRAAVVLRYHEDLSESATAEILGCSVGTVKSQTSRGLAKLRRLLDTEASRA